MIRDAVETWAEVGRAPIVFGDHPEEDGGLERYLKVGNVMALSANDDYTELYGELAFIEPVAPLVREGWMDDRSVGLALGEGGTFYFHHLALLGGLPPAIKGMPALQALETLPEGEFADVVRGREVEAFTFRDDYADDPDDDPAFSDPQPSASDTAMRDFLIQLLNLSDDASDEAIQAALSERMEASGDGDDGDPPEPQFADHPEWQAMQAELEEARAARREGEIEAVRQAASGKMPAPLVDAFADLAAQLPEGALTFSDAGDEVKATPRKRLAALLGQLPDLTKAGPLEFADPDEEGAQLQRKAAVKF